MQPAPEPPALAHRTVWAAFAAFTLLGYAFGRWYMRTGWDLGWRTTQFFFNYQDLGFVKRALIGSLLHPFPALQRNEVFFGLSWLFVGVFVALFTDRFLRARAALTRRDGWVLLALCATSPALFLRQGFDLGRFDALGLMAALWSFGAIERGRWWIAGLLSAIALLAHEAYLVINLPLVAAYAATRKTTAGRPWRGWAALLGPPLVVAFLLGVFGRYDHGLPALHDYFAANPRYLAAKGGTVDDDAIAVLSRRFGEIVDFTAGMFWAKRAWLHLPIIFAWGALMTAFFNAFYRRNGLRHDTVFYASFCPLLLLGLASDYYRWVALAATNMFLVVLLRVRQLADDGATPVVPAGPAVWWLIATAALGPISNTKSFPLPFVLLDWLWPGKIPW